MLVKRCQRHVTTNVFALTQCMLRHAQERRGQGGGQQDLQDHRRQRRHRAERHSAARERLMTDVAYRWDVVCDFTGYEQQVCFLSCSGS